MMTAVVIAAVLAVRPGAAFDAAGADIIGLRLGMSEAEIGLRLAHQGYTVTPTAEGITAATKDGLLRAVLSAERRATAISYTFYGRGAGAPTKIREAILTRFGDPDQATPPTWCRAPIGDGICPTDQASLTYLPDSLTLRLTAAGGDGQ
jgi:hypothetical protein